MVGKSAWWVIFSAEQGGEKERDAECFLRWAELFGRAGQPLQNLFAFSDTSKLRAKM